MRRHAVRYLCAGCGCEEDDPNGVVDHYPYPCGYIESVTFTVDRARRRWPLLQAHSEVMAETWPEVRR